MGRFLPPASRHEKQPTLSGIKRGGLYEVGYSADTAQKVEVLSRIVDQLTAPKLKDPGAPTISCVIVKKALLHLGASVNLLPYSVFGELKPTSATLQLADRSLKTPRGIIEDVLVKVDKFYFLVDFLVFDMEPALTNKKQIPIILGQPFLSTANACINCKMGVMEVLFGNMQVKMDVFQASEHPSNDSECCTVDMVNELMEDILPFTLLIDPLETCLTHFGFENFEIDRSIEKVNILLDFAPHMNLQLWKSQIELLSTLSNELAVPSIVTPPKLELKPLPASLKYYFLGPNDTLPVLLAALRNRYTEETKCLGIYNLLDFYHLD
ncbi:uncharacterized protein LOC114272538 [Camellia sinensis]|uniref:uncharacterized protein LOC114272538 n=1 Tax=Camellia sinensis TaxID=4442 RepID=UPI0010364EF9|nr:uncharacterized protein LOC114272538 [Camellia sinensis]